MGDDGEMSIKAIKKLIYFFLILNVFNIIMDYYVWFMYKFYIPSWVYSTTQLGYMLLIYCLLKLIK